MKSKAIVVIMSRDRSDKQVTISKLSDKILKNTYLAINRGELKAYQDNNPGFKNIVTHSVQGEGPTRKWIMDTFGPKCEHLYMLDDDMDFSVRKVPGSIKITKCEPEDIDDMFKLLSSWLDSGFAQVGISSRGGNNRVEEEWVEISRVVGFHGYNVEKFLASGARFDRIITMLDFDVTLQLLRAGFPNRISYKYCWGQKQSNSPGGCATYRTPSVMKEAAAALAKLHTGFVTIDYHKKTKTGWGDGFGNERTDVVINWKAVYESFRASKRKPSKGFFK